MQIKKRFSSVRVSKLTITLDLLNGDLLFIKEFKIQIPQVKPFILGIF